MPAKSNEPRPEPRVEPRPATDAAAAMVPPAESREELLAEHAAARHRRDTAGLGSDAFREAALEVERIEVAIAALERSMQPPRM